MIIRKHKNKRTNFCIVYCVKICMRVAKNDVVQTFQQRFKNSCKNIQEFTQDTTDTHHQNIKSWRGVLFTHLTNQSLIHWTSQPFYDTSVASAGSNILNNWRDDLEIYQFFIVAFRSMQKSSGRIAESRFVIVWLPWLRKSLTLYLSIEIEIHVSLQWIFPVWLLARM